MERLTERTAVGILVKENYEKESLKTLYSCYGEKPNSYYSNCEEGYCAMEKLADYEDLDEHGRLIKLPCKVGDTVYAIGFNNNKPIIYESVVLSILITEKEIAFNVKVDEFGINSKLKQSMFDKTVFLTKSEAEAKLKELRGGENG
jgi:hypothetical protein|nr:MAG TPA: hypothetical protein [Caudoviricetes sp.]DAM82854.1 MAG TPA: hypothetical protein [Caudoviricetes sp.]